MPIEEVVARIDAVTPDEVRRTGADLLAGEPTLAAIGPIGRLPPLPRIAAQLHG
jgi:predicted Zn-dependent peptidase